MADYTAATYAAERAICDTAIAYAERVMCEGGPKRRRNYLTAQEAAHSDYAACDNAMRGRVEQFELLRDLPDAFGAYIEGSGDGVGANVRIIVWTGDTIGTGTVETIAKGGRFGERQRYGHATIGGKRYRWQGKGVGMYCSLKAAPLRKSA